MGHIKFSGQNPSTREPLCVMMPGRTDHRTNGELLKWDERRKGTAHTRNPLKKMQQRRKVWSMEQFGLVHTHIPYAADIDWVTQGRHLYIDPTLLTSISRLPITEVLQSERHHTVSFSRAIRIPPDSTCSPLVHVVTRSTSKTRLLACLPLAHSRGTFCLSFCPEYLASK